MKHNDSVLSIPSSIYIMLTLQIQIRSASHPTAPATNLTTINQSRQPSIAKLNSKWINISNLFMEYL